ncbi:hypothetical protein BB427_16355 [Pseudoalteromonas sp. BMB]|uniref:ParB family protein n=1 Tax=Pseudoalteromonas sp. BMB TaxID=1874619 RepID=UPI00083CB43F|nr:ParB family protein [Pseudoalteromonas sp. BMB]ODB35878.1 hypothetical protein BB427_16355 [Pseudoalteromonas sp. BMB]
MAKKRDPFGVNPLGNTPGGQEAANAASKFKLDKIFNDLTECSSAMGVDLRETLQDRFGIVNDPKKYDWKLDSGRVVTFYEVELDYETIRDQTFVRFNVNGRDQTYLNKESLSDLDSLADQQFYPAIARAVDDKFEILDGSRRRAKFLLANAKIAKFRLLITKDELSVAEAREFAKKLQTSKEHSLREIGKRALAIKSELPDIGQVELAKQLGVSQAKVSRALTCANVSDELVLLFGTLDELTFEDFKKLGKIEKMLGGNMVTLVQSVKAALDSGESNREVERKQFIFELIQSGLKELEFSVSKTKAVKVTQLKEYKSAGVYARKKMSGRTFAYEFSRLPDSIQQQLDKAIMDVLESNAKNH